MIGIFIGSFNPPTMAHINICKKLKYRFNKIVLVPVNSSNKTLISFRKRMNMLYILKNKYPFLEIDMIMEKYSYLNYRIIDILKNKYGDINIIIGSDLLENFSGFDNYEYLLANYSFTVIPRDGIDIEKLIKEKYLKYQDKFNILKYHSSISSSLVRNKIRNNEKVNSYIDKDVYEYIKENNLYKSVNG